MSYIKRDFIDDLLSVVDIKEVVSESEKLKKVGSNWFCSSPFSEDKSASFCVNIVKQRFTCYSTGIGGNAVSFLMEKKGISFVESIEYLAKKYHKEVAYESKEIAEKKKEKQQKKKALRPLLKATQKLYKNAFKELPENHRARIETEFRGYDTETIIDWGIGFAPGNKLIYNNVIEIARKNDAKELGLINDKNDKYYNRLTYPIHDYNGLIVGFAGRTLGNTKIAKWINPSQSNLYEKDKIWYGMDRAKSAIVKKKEAWIVEGYNDVIAWHNLGITNTIASCGTAIMMRQIKALKKICKHAIFCMDDDTPGVKAMLKYIPIFLQEGFTVEVVTLNGCDPDSFTRVYSDVKNLPEVIQAKEFRIDGFSFLLDHHLGGKTELEKSKEAQSLCQIISDTSDEATRVTYTSWLVKESGVSRAIINKWLKNNEVLPIVNDNKWEEYELPKEVTIPLSELEEDIKRYSMFQANNRIYMMIVSKNKKFFTSVSNFEIEIIQHMDDERFPTKLIRIKNTDGIEKIFDLPSNDVNTPATFFNSVSGRGNYFYQGDLNQHRKLLVYLFDKMGVGRKIEILGWQPEGFFATNNKIIIPGKESIVLDSNGVFKYDNVSYYIPSANKVYSGNPFKYQAQKKVIIKEIPKFTFQQFTSQLVKVHGGFGITGMLYTIMTMFRDVVTNYNHWYPVVFFYGPPGTGKDNIIVACQSFFGIPQEGLNLESNMSTQKSQVREFAQFSNLVSHLSEYKKGIHDGMLKGLWDLRGYKRSHQFSSVTTESIPILSGAFLTGNEYPDNEALLTRLIWNEMSQNEFSEQEGKDYNVLKEMIETGVSGFTESILQLRPLFKKQFKKQYKFFKNELIMQFEGNTRIFENLACLCATYDILKDELKFPFSFTQMMDHFKDMINKHQRKLNSASIITRWWDCFLASLRGSIVDQLVIGKDYKLDGVEIYFNMSAFYNKIQRQWYTQYREAAPSKAVMVETLKKEEGYKGQKKSERLGKGKDAPNTSVHIIDISKILMYEDIVSAVSWQAMENGQTTSWSKPKSAETNASPPTQNVNQPKLPF